MTLNLLEGPALDATGRGETSLALDYFKPLRRALLLIVIGLGGFGGWLCLAQLKSATHAEGMLVIDGKRKPVQHLDGGLVRLVLMREGEVIERGQPILELDDTLQRIDYQQAVARFVETRLRQSRLRAERLGQPQFDVPEDLTPYRDTAEFQTLLDAERKIFRTRRDTLDGKLRVFDQQIALTEQDRQGLGAKRAAGQRSLQLVGDQLVVVEEMVRKSYQPRSRLIGLQREEAELRGLIGQVDSDLAQVTQRVGGLKLQRANAITDFDTQVATDLQQVESQIQDLEKAVSQRREVLERRVLRAPEGGRVLNLTVTAPGSVIAPGQIIAEIVPQDEELVVEALVPPERIEEVAVGQSVEVRLLAFSARDTPPVRGQVTYVSADRVDTPPGGALAATSAQPHPRPGYLARIALDQTMLHDLGLPALNPGMTADVLIVSGERTPLSYFTRPIARSFRQAFIER